MNAIEISNVAVSQLANGDIDSANRLIEMAMHLTTVGHVQPDCSVYTKFSWSRDAPLPNVIEKMACGFVYSRCIEITSTSGMLSRECQAAILYNGAVIQQSLALKTQESSLLHRSKMLYNLARKVLKVCLTSSLLHRLYLHLAILNNLSQLWYMLSDYVACKACCEQLGKAIAMHKKQAWRVYGIDEIVGMAQNAMFEIPISAPCA